MQPARTRIGKSVHHDVSKLAGHVPVAVVELAVIDHGRGDAGAYRQPQHILEAFARSMHRFAVYISTNVVVNVHRQVQPRLQPLGRGQVAPAEVAREPGDPFFRIDESRQADPGRGDRDGSSRLAGKTDGRFFDHGCDFFQNGVRALGNLRGPFDSMHDLAGGRYQAAYDVGSAHIHACIYFHFHTRPALFDRF